jgi:protocatechuate 3,4-dioxygenase beta subunit
MRNRSKATVPSFAILSLCVLASGSHAFAQDTPTPTETSGAAASTDRDKQLCTIGGTVTSLATGEPLKKVTVSLKPENPDKNHPGKWAFTDASGKFSIAGIPPGRYSLVLDREGYVEQSYGQDKDSDTGALLSLAAGQRMEDLIFRLQKTAVITGRVLDEDGQPLVRASVEILQRHKVNGENQFFDSGSENTDDQGIYRIFGLAPGRYFVRVRPQENRSTFVSSDDDGDDGGIGPPQKIEYPVTYYPGTPDSARASAIDVRPGDEIPRIDFFIAPREAIKRYVVRGHVTNALGGDTQATMMVALMPQSLEDAPSSRLFTRPNEKTGNFEIPNVPPGRYAVIAQAFGGTRPRSVAQEIQVANSDVDSVSLILTRGVDVAGRIVFEGQAAAATSQVTVAIEPLHMEFTFLGASQATPKPDGSFTLSEIGDGTYSVQVYSKCSECYLKSATANGVDLLAQGLTVAAGGTTNAMDLVYSSNTGKAAGTVTGADDLPVPGAYVMLVNETTLREDKGRSWHTATTDQYGNFEVTGVPPGNYKALAWRKSDPDADSDPDSLGPFLEHAESVDVSVGSTARLSLKAIAGSPTDPTN